MFTVYTHSIPHYSPLCPTASATAKATASTTARAAASGDRRGASEECRAAVSGGSEQQHHKPTAPDSEEEDDEDGEVTQIFVKTDEGRTSALQVTSRETTGGIVQRAWGRTIVDEAGARAMSREDVQEWGHRRKLQSGWRHVAADARDVWRCRKQE